MALLCPLSRKINSSNPVCLFSTHNAIWGLLCWSLGFRCKTIKNVIDLFWFNSNLRRNRFIPFSSELGAPILVYRTFFVWFVAIRYLQYHIFSFLFPHLPNWCKSLQKYNFWICKYAECASTFHVLHGSSVQIFNPHMVAIF